MHHHAKYLYLEPNAQLPKLNEISPFKIVILSDVEVSPEWQILVSDWLVNSGCLYAIAWGTNCSEWDDSIDFANLKQFESTEIPDENFVMTTWHEDESLIDVFQFAKNVAFHPTIELEQTILLHISTNNKEYELLKLYSDA